MSRVVLASNRLPVSLHRTDDGWSLAPSSGGLVGALRGEHARRGSLWIGWPGDGPDEGPEREDVTARLRALESVPVYLTAREKQAFYDGFSNGMLWPLFHAQLDRLPLDAASEWGVYRDVNLRFAQELARAAAREDIVWVHDYHLTLVPQMLRALRPGVRSGFFLHIPFPPPDVFRVLPWRRELLRGILGADIVGFHTARDLEHFLGSVSELLPEARCRAEEVTGRGAVVLQGHVTRVGVHPIGIDAEAIEALAKSHGVGEAVARIRDEARGRRILLGVDRLDYTKGIPRRLLAFDQLLKRWPELRDQVHFIQLAVPTRESVDAYGKFRRMVNELVGRINARHGTTGAVPIHLLYRSVPLEELVALYRAADVMVVTPLRDGMNLVAKEYVAARVDDGGALVLSELAGAAAQLTSALQVNPYDVHGTALAIREALLLPADEGQARMRAMREVVRTSTAGAWATAFLDEVESIELTADASVTPLEAATASLAAAPTVTLLLDYDGTLVPFARSPELARPDAELLTLLKALAALPGVRVHIVSGRTRPSLDEFFVDIPVDVHAEHGGWARTHDGTWRGRLPERPPWFAAARGLVVEAAALIPGSLVEEKSFGVALHLRGVEGDVRKHVAHLRDRLDALGAMFDDVAIRPGEQVLEVRPTGIHKGVVVEELLARGHTGAILAVGDDLTDEDLFAALPPSAVSVHVGAPRKTAALHHVDTPDDVRALLRAVIEARLEARLAQRMR